MSPQVNSSRISNWETVQNQQQQQQESFLNQPYKKIQPSSNERETPPVTRVKVWHEGAD